MASTSQQPKPGATAVSVDNLVNSGPLNMTFSNDLHHHWAAKRLHTQWIWHMDLGIWRILSVTFTKSSIIKHRSDLLLLRNRMGRCGLALPSSGYRPVASSWEHGNGPSGSRKCGEFLHQLSSYRLLRRTAFHGVTAVYSNISEACI